MMVDVDAFTRRFGSLIATHCKIAFILNSQDRLTRPQAYDTATFSNYTKDNTLNPLKVVQPRPHLTSTLVNAPSIGSVVPMHPANLTLTPEDASSSVAYGPVDNPTSNHLPTSIAPASSITIPSWHISSSPVLYTSSFMHYAPIQTRPVDHDIRVAASAGSLFSECWCINDICGASCIWASEYATSSSRLTFRHLFTSAHLRCLFKVVHPHAKSELRTIPSMTPDPDCLIITIDFVKDSLCTVVQWFDIVGELLARAIKFSS